MHLHVTTLHEGTLSKGETILEGEPSQRGTDLDLAAFVRLSRYFSHSSCPKVYWDLTLLPDLLTSFRKRNGQGKGFLVIAHVRQKGHYMKGLTRCSSILAPLLSLSILSN